MLVERKNNEVIVRLDGAVDIDFLQKTLDYLRYIELGAKSKATQNQVDKLASDLVPGSTMHPGEFLRNELEAREMKQVDLSKELGIAKNVMSEIINGKRNITPGLAVKLEDALGIKAEFWMRYQMSYEIDKIRIRNRKSVQKANISEKAKHQLASI